MKEPIVYGTPVSQKFAENLAEELGVELGHIEHRIFSDGEHEIEILDLPRGRPTIIVGGTPSPFENLLHFCMLAHTAWRNGATSIVGVIPHFGYTRQDKPKPDHPGRSVGMAVCGRMLSRFPIDWLFIMDLHNSATGSMLKEMRRQELYASEVFLPIIREFAKENTIVVSPDVGRFNLVNDIYRSKLGISAVTCYKHRKDEGGIEIYGVLGNVAKKDVILIDDIISTGSTLLGAVSALREAGAEKIIAFATHAVLSGNAKVDLPQSAISEIFVTDTMFHEDLPRITKMCQPYFKVISVVPLFAKRIAEICGL